MHGALSPRAFMLDDAAGMLRSWPHMNPEMGLRVHIAFPLLGFRFRVRFSGCKIAGSRPAVKGRNSKISDWDPKLRVWTLN